MPDAADKRIVLVYLLNWPLISSEGICGPFRLETLTSGAS